MEIVEDHVHLFLEFHPSISLSRVVQYLKGSNSYRLFRLILNREDAIEVEIYGHAANFFVL